MSKKTVVTPQKSPLLVEGTYTDEVHAPSFNILIQTPSPNICDCLLTVYTKSEDGAISKSEVTGTVASKFGGPLIAKEHVSNTINYSTPRTHTRNSK
ncbi:hypothetical protein H5410_048397 [Solanum commersonii]|uniref:Uncharacterized protein n=1 Tax=Solanum commersonii TaxID=4109 RepID=A0A9J5XI19_SOLCO|nr:hypothetical protein H5410_048397 [Solanum commersonii]